MRNIYISLINAYSKVLSKNTIIYIPLFHDHYMKGENMSTPLAVLEQKMREIGVSPQTITEARAKLKRAIREFWASPEGEKLSRALSAMAHVSGYAARVKAIMKNVADDLERAAEETEVGEYYKYAWGKESKVKYI
jgi:hypothetical protein